MRFLFWLALIGLIYFALRSKWQAAQRKAKQAAPPEQQANIVKRQVSSERMLECAHCAVYFPESEAVRVPSDVDGAEELVFCCSQHQQQYQQHAQQQAQKIDLQKKSLQNSQRNQP